MSLIYARVTSLPPRDFASGRNPCGGNNILATRRRHLFPYRGLPFDFSLLGANCFENILNLQKKESLFVLCYSVIRKFAAR